MKTSYTGLTLACLSGLLLLNRSEAAASNPSNGTVLSVPTLGGSGFDASGVNTNGQVTGFSYLPGDTASHAFLFSGGSQVDLGTLGGATSWGYAINNLGHVVGNAATSTRETHGFLYNGSLVDLGTLGGGYSEAIGINDAGQVAGNSATPDWANQAFLYTGGELEPLGDLGGGNSQAVAINQKGTVAGDSSTASTEYHGFLYRNGQMKDIGTLGGDYSSVYALNNNDVVVGESAHTNGQYMAFVYANGTMSSLGTLGGSFSSPQGLNDAGQVIGISTTEGDLENHGFIYLNGAMVDLGTLGGSDTQPNAINNQGQVVGYSITADGYSHAFVWKDGVMTDLNSLLPPDSGWELTSAQFITDTGIITGYGVKDEVYQYFVFSPAVQNTDPVAVAGPDQVVECPEAVTLDGSQSSDPDKDELKYEWSIAGTVLGTDAKLTVSLPLGANVVSLKVTDPSGASSTSTLKVLVKDTTPPTGSCPGNALLPADAVTGQAAVPNFAAQVRAEDNCSSADTLKVTQSPAAGTLLGVGQHSVTLTVTDESGNASTCQVVFTVVDQTPPVITQVPADQTVAAGNQCQALVPDLLSKIRVTDNCYAPGQLKLTQSPAPGTPLPCGEYLISLSATDGSGNTSSVQVGFKVTDSVAPQILSVTASPSVISPPNHQLVPVTVTVHASDNCDASPTSRITGVTCDEPLSPGDYQVTGPLSVKLAADRNSSGDGRTYTIWLECKDGSGNSNQGSATVFVPKGNSGSTKSAKSITKLH